MFIPWDKSSGALQNKVGESLKEELKLMTLKRLNPPNQQHCILKQQSWLFFFFFKPTTQPAFKFQDTRHRRAKRVLFLFLIQTVGAGRGGGARIKLSQHICLPPIRTQLSPEVLAQDLLSRARSNRYFFIIETKGARPLINRQTCSSKCRREMWDPTVSQFVHTWKLLEIQVWEGVGRGPMVFHTLHWKGF